MKRLLFAIALSGIGFTGISAAVRAVDASGLPQTKAPVGADVSIISPGNGAVVGRQVSVRFGFKGMGAAPAGVATNATGHHPLLIDVKELPPAGQPIPKDDQHMHFGGGQTEASVKVKPGVHTLQLELADANHLPFDPPLASNKITLHVL